MGRKAGRHKKIKSSRREKKQEGKSTAKSPDRDQNSRGSAVRNDKTSDENVDAEKGKGLMPHISKKRKTSF